MHMLSSKQALSSAEMQEATYAPMRILEIEIGQPLPTLSAIDKKTGRQYQRAMCLIRLHTQPLGVVEIELAADETSADTYAQHIWDVLGEQINEHLYQDGLSPVTRLDVTGLVSSSIPRCLEDREQFLLHAPFVSVIIPTHDRPELIERCLRSLLALDYPHYEIIVVDNAPSTPATADFIRQTYHDIPQVRYLREDRAGPSWARNCGMMAAKGELLAFIDDDVVVDTYWLVELMRGFSLYDDVACVTGLLLPLELETPAQIWLEEFGGFSKKELSKGFTQRIFDMKENRPKIPLYPYIAGRFGTGASMAFRSAFLRSVGGFDPALGGNGPVRWGQDIATFFQVVIRGHKLVYSPTSLVYHPHQRDYLRLRKQIYHYGIGFTAFLMKSVLENPRLLFDLAVKVPYGLFRFFRVHAPKSNQELVYYPKELTMIELKGMLYGPIAYLQSRRLLCKAYKVPKSTKTRAVLPVEKEM